MTRWITAVLYPHRSKARIVYPRQTLSFHAPKQGSCTLGKHSHSMARRAGQPVRCHSSWCASLIFKVWERRAIGSARHQTAVFVTALPRSLEWDPRDDGQLAHLRIVAVGRPVPLAAVVFVRSFSAERSHRAPAARLPANFPVPISMPRRGIKDFPLLTQVTLNANAKQSVEDF